MLYCRNPYESFVSEADLDDILRTWKFEYQQWMCPEVLQHSWNKTQRKLHEFLRSAFRNHLFKMMGSYEMAVFFIVAPFSIEHLLVFRREDSSTKDKAEKLEEYKAYVRTKNEQDSCFSVVQAIECAGFQNMM